MKVFSIIKVILNAYLKPRQHISIDEVPGGSIIDIGGGGEGVIAQVGGNRVIAIDQYLSEIHEAREKAPGTPWLVADATELPLLDNCLDNATAFFSCMYMSDSVKENVFRETIRVLKQGGEFWVWGVQMTSRKDLFAIRLQVDYPEIKTKRTIYGVKAKDQSVDSICALLKKAGFGTEVITLKKHWFFIKARRE